MEETPPTGEVDLNLAAYNLDTIADQISNVWFNINQLTKTLVPLTEGLKNMAGEMREAATKMQDFTNRYENDLR